VRRLAAIDPTTFGDKQHSIVQRFDHCGAKQRRRRLWPWRRKHHSGLPSRACGRRFV
jgi:hypothetical protein